MKVGAPHLLLLPLTPILLILVPSLASLPPISGKVNQVKDGDTVVMSAIEGCQFFICRLYGIDALETPKQDKRGQL